MSCKQRNSENMRMKQPFFVKLYEWYKMPASAHKILIHGADVMDTLLLPIGQLSEEASEAMH